MRAPHALIIEDVTDLATIYTQALTAAGFEVTWLDDGLTAQEYLAEHTPDLLLLDLHLPTLSGDKILHQVRQDNRFSRVKVIVATANSSLASELDDEADLVLHKPVSFLQLRNLSFRMKTTMSQLCTKPLPNTYIRN